MTQLKATCTLEKFLRNAEKCGEALARTGRHAVLSVHGKPSVVIQDAEAYQAILDKLDRLEAMEGIRRGIEDVKRGAVRPLREVMDELKRKYESDSHPS